MRLLIFISCFYTLIQSTFSQNYQKGEALLVDSKKVSGYFSTTLNKQSQLAYKISLDGEVKYLDAIKTKYVVVDSVKMFISKECFFKKESATIFAKAVVTGKYSLYEGSMSYSSVGSVTFFIVDKDDRLYVVPQILNINFFKQIYGDCAVEGVNTQTKVKFMSAEVVIKANKCKNEPYRVFFKLKPANIHLNLRGGYNQWANGQIPFYLYKPVELRGLYFGSNFQIIFSNKLFFETGVNFRFGRGENVYGEWKFSSTVPDSIRTTFNIKNNYVDIPFYLGYSLKVNPNNFLQVKVGANMRVGRTLKTYLFTPKSQFNQINLFYTKDQLARLGIELVYRKHLKLKEYVDFTVGYFNKDFFLGSPKKDINFSPVSFNHMFTFGINYSMDLTKRSKYLE